MATAGQALCLALYTSHALLRMPLLVDPTGSTLPHFLTTLKCKECQCLCKGGPGPELHSTAGGRALRTVEAEEGKQGEDGSEEHGTRFTNPCKGAGRAGGEGRGLQHKDGDEMGRTETGRGNGELQISPHHSRLLQLAVRNRSGARERSQTIKNLEVMPETRQSLTHKGKGSEEKILGNIHR